MQDEPIDILILGKGSREAAILEALRHSPRCGKVYGFLSESESAPLPDMMDFRGVADFCCEHGIDMLVVGPPEPIVAGIRDYLSDIPELGNLKVIAPGREGAALEGSKEFAKEFMCEEGIPSPRFMPVDGDTLDEGIAFLNSMQPPYVLKADGLADGRGVAIVENLAEAKDMLEEMITDGIYGESGRTVLIEQYVEGTECSIMVATDGEDFAILPTARDYKRLHNGDTGPNTAGMGAVSPAKCADDEFVGKTVKHIIAPTLRALKERGIEYQGFLYFGIMNVDGEPILLEYNARLGDPEAQAVLPLLKTDFMELLDAISTHNIGNIRIEQTGECTAAVVLASEGYPAAMPEEPREIEGLDKAMEVQDIRIYPGQMKKDRDGMTEAVGKRVLTIVGTAPDEERAAMRAYEALSHIRLEGGVSRSDIGRGGACI